MTYKLIPPPSFSCKRKIDKVNEENIQEQIDANDVYCQNLQNIENSYNERNLHQLYNLLKDFCNYIEDKQIPKKIPFLEQYHIIEIIINLCIELKLQQNITGLDLLFRLMYIFTQEPDYCMMIPIDLLIEFLNIDEIYENSDWYFKLLSNYFLHDYTFKPIRLSFIYNHIQALTDGAKILNALRFIEIFCKLKFNTENSKTNMNYIKSSSLMVLHIVSYFSEAFNVDDPKNALIIRSLTIMLERLTKRQCLDVLFYRSLNIKKFVRRYFMNFPKLTKFVGYFIYYYKYSDVDLVMLANSAFDNSDLNQDKYSLWVMYNLLTIDNKQICVYDNGDFTTIDIICGYLYNQMNNLQFSIKKQAIMLIALLHSLAPLNKIHENILTPALQLFIQFTDDYEDIEMIDNIFNAMYNIYNFLKMCGENLESQMIPSLFNECKESLEIAYHQINPEKLQILQSMT